MPLNFPALDNFTLSPKENNSFKSRLMAMTLCFLGFKLSNLKPLAVTSGVLSVSEVSAL